MTISKAAVAALIAAALAGTPAHADPAADREKVRTVGNQVSEDLITCSAFFTISAQRREMVSGTARRHTSGSTFISASVCVAFAVLLVADEPPHLGLSAVRGARGFRLSAWGDCERQIVKKDPCKQAHAARPIRL